MPIFRKLVAVSQRTVTSVPKQFKSYQVDVVQCLVTLTEQVFPFVNEIADPASALVRQLCFGNIAALFANPFDPKIALLGEYENFISDMATNMANYFDIINQNRALLKEKGIDTEIKLLFKLSLSIQFRNGMIHFVKSDHNMAAGAFLKVVQQDPSPGCAESAIAPFYLGLCQLYLTPSSDEAFRYFTTYFGTVPVPKNQTQTLYEPVFHQQIPQQHRLDYFFLLIQKKYSRITTKESEKQKNYALILRLAQSYLAEIATREIPEALAHDTKLIQIMRVVCKELKRSDIYLKILDSPPTTIALVKEKFTIALANKNDPFVMSSLVDGLIEAGAITPSGKQLAQRPAIRVALWNKVIKLLDQPEDPLHRFAVDFMSCHYINSHFSPKPSVKGVSLEPLLTDHAAKPLQRDYFPKHLPKEMGIFLSCGHIVHKSEVLETSGCLPQSPKVKTCPCCKKKHTPNTDTPNIYTNARLQWEAVLNNWYDKGENLPQVTLAFVASRGTLSLSNSGAGEFLRHLLETIHDIVTHPEHEDWLKNHALYILSHLETFPIFRGKILGKNGLLPKILPDLDWQVIKVCWTKHWISSQDYWAVFLELASTKDVQQPFIELCFGLFTHLKPLSTQIFKELSEEKQTLLLAFLIEHSKDGQGYAAVVELSNQLPIIFTHQRSGAYLIATLVIEKDRIAKEKLQPDFQDLLSKTLELTPIQVLIELILAVDETPKAPETLTTPEAIWVYYLEKTQLFSAGPLEVRCTMQLLAQWAALAIDAENWTVLDQILQHPNCSKDLVVRIFQKVLGCPNPVPTALVLRVIQKALTPKTNQPTQSTTPPQLSSSDMVAMADKVWAIEDQVTPEISGDDITANSEPKHPRTDELTTAFNQLLIQEFEHNFTALLHSKHFKLATRVLEVLPEQAQTRCAKEAWKLVLCGRTISQDLTPIYEKIIRQIILFYPVPLTPEDWFGTAERVKQFRACIISALVDRIKTLNQYTEILHYPYLEDILSKYLENPDYPTFLSELQKKIPPEKLENLYIALLIVASRQEDQKHRQTILQFINPSEKEADPQMRSIGDLILSAYYSGTITEIDTAATLLAQTQSWQELVRLIETRSVDICIPGIAKNVFSHPNWKNTHWKALFLAIEQNPALDVSLIQDYLRAPGKESRTDLGDRLVKLWNAPYPSNLPEAILKEYLPHADCPPPSCWATEMVKAGYPGLLKMQIETNPSCLYGPENAPLFQCCEQASQLRWVKTLGALKVLDEMVGIIFDNVVSPFRVASSQGGLSQEAQTLITKTSELIASKLDNPLPDLVRRTMQEWKDRMQRIQFREAYTFSVDKLRTVITENTLALMVGNSVLPQEFESSPDAPEQIISIFTAFLSFLAGELKTKSTSPLLDFKLPTTALEQTLKRLLTLQTAYIELKKLRQTFLKKGLRAIPPDHFYRLLGTTLNPTLAKMVANYSPLPPLVFRQHLYFTTRNDGDLVALLAQMGTSLDELLNNPTFLSLLRETPGFQEAESNWIAEQWQKLSRSSELVLPTGFWATNARAVSPNWSATVLQRSSGQLRVVHINSGQGVKYHPGVLSSTVTTTAEESEKTDSKKVVLLAKTRFQPFLTKTLTYSGDSTPPEWFVYLMQLGLVQRQSNGLFFRQEHFYEALWPVISGETEIPNSPEAMSASSKTPMRSATSAMALVTNMAFWGMLSTQTTPGSPSAEHTAQLENAHQTFKRLMVVFYLWLGTAVKTQLTAGSGLSETLALELGNTITSGCLNQLSISAQGAPHLLFLIAQTQKTASSLVDVSEKQRQPLHLIPVSDLTSRLPVQFALPRFLPLENFNSVVRSGSQDTVAPAPRLSVVTFNQAIDYAETLLDHLKKLEKKDPSVRIPHTLKAIETWALAQWPGLTQWQIEGGSDIKLNEFATRVADLSNRYSTALIQRRFLAGNPTPNPLDHGISVLTSATAVAVLTTCLRQHPLLGPAFKGHTIPIGYICGYIEGFPTILSKLIVPNKQWATVAQGCRRFFDLDSQHRTPVFSTENSHKSLMCVTIDSEIHKKVPIFEIIESLISRSPDLKDYKRTDPRFSTDKVYRNSILLLDNPFPVLRSLIVTAQYATVTACAAPPHITHESQSPPLRTFLSENDGKITVFISFSLWARKKETLGLPEMSHTVPQEQRMLFSDHGRTENVVLASAAADRSDLPLAQHHHLLLLGSEAIGQRMERIYAHIQDGLLNIEDSAHQKLIFQLIWQVSTNDKTSFSTVLKSQRELLHGFANLIDLQFEKLKEKGHSSINGIGFLASLAVIFRQYTAPDEETQQEQWNRLITKIRQTMLDLASSTAVVQTQMSATLFGLLICTYRFELTFQSNEDLNHFLHAISLFKKYRNLGNSCRDTANDAPTHSRSFEQDITDTIVQLYPAVQEGLHQQPAILNSLAEERGLTANPSEKWKKGNETKFWTCKKLAFDPLTGNFYQDGYPVGCLPPAILDHPNYTYYFQDQRFEVRRDPKTGLYYSLKLLPVYRFGISQRQIQELPVLRGGQVKYGIQLFSSTPDWHSHTPILKECLTLLQRLCSDNRSPYNVLFNGNNYLFISKPWLFLAKTASNSLQMIAQLRFEGDEWVEVPIYTKSDLQFMGPDSDHSLQKNKHQRFATKPPDSELAIESEREPDVWYRAMPHWIMESHLPGMVSEGLRNPGYWSTTNQILIVDKDNRTRFVLDRTALGDYILKDNSQSQIVNVFRSNGNSALERLSQFENPNYIVVECTPTSSDSPDAIPQILRFPRLNLSFALTTVDKSAVWASQEMVGLHLAPIQTLPLWPTFLRYLVFIEDQTAGTLDSKIPYENTPFRLVIPHVEFEQTTAKDGIQSEVTCTANRILIPGYVVVKYDPLTRRFRTDSTLGKLILAFLFYATASLKKSPYTDLNGYQMASEILKECVQNSPYTAAESKILSAILESKNPHRNARAFRLMAAALTIHSTSLVSFHSSSESKIPDVVAKDYRIYISEVRRISQLCRLEPWQLQLVQRKLSPPSRSVSRTDDAVIAKIPEVDFNKAITVLSTLDCKSVKLLPKLVHWAEYTGPISGIFLSTLYEICTNSTLSQDDFTYFLRFLALDHLKESEDIVLLQLLVLVNKLRPKDVPLDFWDGDETPFDIRNLFFSEKDLKKIIQTHCYIESETLERLVAKWITELTSPWKDKPFGNGLVPKANFEKGIEKICNLAELASLDMAQKQTLTSRLTTALSQRYRNQKATNLLLWMAKFAERVKKRPLVTASAPTRMDVLAPTPLQEATLALQINPLDGQPIAKELTEELKKILTSVVSEAPVCQTYEEGIQHVEAALAQAQPSRFVRAVRTKRPEQPFPLQAYSTLTNSVPLSAAYKSRMEQSQKSWEAYINLPLIRYELDPTQFQGEQGARLEALSNQTKRLLAQWSSAAKILETWISGVADRVRDDAAGWRHWVSRMEGQISLTKKDIVRLLHNKSVLETYNPFLRDVSGLLVSAVLLYAQIESLCQHLRRVLDHIARMDGSEDRNSQLANHRLCKIMAEERTFDPKTHPEKLLFELQNSLIIRRRQHALVSLMVDNNKTLAQMDMGEGKTSVVLMLILIELAKQGKLTRVFVPNKLIVALEHLFKSRVGEGFGMLVYLFPFKRSILNTISLNELDRLKQQVQFCKQNHHVIFMTPEQGLSLRLIIEEARLNLTTLDTKTETYKRIKDIHDTLIEIAKAVDVDIFDEVDSILTLHTETNFTIGSRFPIDGSPQRYTVAIQFIRTLLFDPEIHQIINKIPGISLKKEGQTVQILLASHEDYTPELRNALAEKSIAHHFPGLSVTAREAYIRFIVSPTSTMADFLAKNTVSEDKVNALRTLRCWCNPRIAGFVLGQRNRVDYGLFDPSTSSEEAQQINGLCAVPFHGKDTPLPDSTFEHADVRIGFTILSYFYDGLKQNELKKALEHLRLSYYARASVFSHWISTTPETCSLKTWNQISLSNPDHIQELMPVLARNPEVIIYYLTNIVFADATGYKQKIGADGSTLVQVPAIVNGFSGTSTRALPRGVRTDFHTRVTDEDLQTEFMATEAMTLALFNDPKVVQVQDDPLPATTEGLLDAIVLRLARSPYVNVLLDPGALITGLSNKQVAMALMEKIGKPTTPDELNRRIKGVVYFDDDTDELWVSIRTNKMVVCMPKSGCQLPETHLLTYFNQPKTRGQDLQLPDCVALLFVGKNNTCDEITQAAKRMRRLGLGQTLEICMQPDIQLQIKQFHSNAHGSNKVALSGNLVYAWSLRNTVAKEETALKSQESRFRRAQWQQNVLTRPTQQIHVQESELLLSIYDSAQADDPHLGDIMVQISKQSKQTTTDQEVELDHCAEVQVETKTLDTDIGNPTLETKVSYSETPWAYSDILKPVWFSDRGAFGQKQVICTKSIAEWLFGDTATGLPEYFNHVHITENYLRVTREKSTGPLQDRLRPAESYLEIRDKEKKLHLILLSGDEAQKVKTVLLSTEGQSSTLHLALRQLSDPVGPTVVASQLVRAATEQFNNDQQRLLVLASLINGESGLLMADIGPAFAQTETETAERVKSILVEIFKQINPESPSYKSWLDKLALIRKLRGKERRFNNSPLAEVISPNRTPLPEAKPAPSRPTPGKQAPAQRSKKKSTPRFLASTARGSASSAASSF